ncbi:MAG: Methyltransferase type 11 [Blastococcus sp.]|jgi:SAM-dependent methyltransferase|nr:Methyltransferase type 11 [Blastococcus sp.]
MGLEEVQREWDRYGREDPLWAVYTSSERRGGKWDDESFFETGRREVAEVLELTDPSPDGRCLDFGCGVGRLTLPLAAHFREAVGVDIAPSMIEKANSYKGSAGNVSYVLNQREDLGQFPDGSFDFINSSIVLQHMSPALALGYLREFSRLLAPGGQLTFTLPTGPSSALKGWFYRVVPRPVVYAYKRRRHGVTMEMNAIPIERLIGHLEGFGLHVDKVRSSGSAGRGWRAFRYCCTKQPASGSAYQREDE